MAPPTIDIAETGPDVPDDVLNVDTIASEVHGLQHSMRQMARSDAEMAEMIEQPEQHGLDADDVQELKLALEENVGVMERKRQLLAKMTKALEQALQASGLVLDPENHHAQQALSIRGTTDASTERRSLNMAVDPPSQEGTGEPMDQRPDADGGLYL